MFFIWEPRNVYKMWMTNVGLYEKVISSQREQLHIISSFLFHYVDTRMYSCCGHLRQKTFFMKELCIILFGTSSIVLSPWLELKVTVFQPMRTVKNLSSWARSNPGWPFYLTFNPGNWWQFLSEELCGKGGMDCQHLFRILFQFGWRL